MERPVIELGEFIEVQGVECVICLVREPGHTFGDCEVVCTPNKPANREVCWAEDHWEFKKSSDFGGYADKTPRLRRYVEKLKRGR